MQIRPIATAIKSEAVSNVLSRAMTLYPFFGSYFYTNMDMITTHQVRTAATDGKAIYFNPDWMESMMLDEALFVFCHEVLHAIFDHMGRGKYWQLTGFGPDGKKWSHDLANKAADYIINSILVESKIGRMPSGDNAGLLRADITADMTFEDAYKYLSSEQQQQTPPPPPPPGNGNSEGEPDDNESAEQPSGNGAGNADESESQDEGQGQGEDEGDTFEEPEGHGGFDTHFEADEPVDEGEAMTRVKQALETAKLMGDMPAGLLRAIEKLMEPVVAWEEELRQAMELTVGNDEMTWSKPHRRRLATMDMYFPSGTGFQTGGVVVQIDTSGSVSDAEINRFVSEVSGIMSNARPEWVKVLWVDAEVAGVDEPDEPEDLPYLEPKGHGGTDMGAGLKYIAAMDEEPETIVVLTDGWTPWGKEPDNAHIIWGITDKRKTAPFGKTIHVEVN